MLTGRLLDRCPSAKVMASGFVSGHSFKSTKMGDDNSGKAGLVRSPSQTNGTESEPRVHGVLFDIAWAELPLLDRAEAVGRGYEREDDLSITLTANGATVTASTYIATRMSEQLRPYDWYMSLVLAGANEHNLPEDWIAMLRSIEVIADPLPNRSTRLNALKILINSESPML